MRRTTRAVLHLCCALPKKGSYDADAYGSVDRLTQNESACTQDWRNYPRVQLNDDCTHGLAKIQSSSPVCAQAQATDTLLASSELHWSLLLPHFHCANLLQTDQ